jgi:uncharacterized protein YndB with AHSA1/START domain
VATATASTVIDAPMQLIWDVMLDVERYPEWNPFIVEVGLPEQRPPEVGDRLVLHVRWRTGGRTRSSERVTALEPPSASGGRRALLEYQYAGPLGGVRLVQGRRRQELNRLDDGITTYTTFERLHGPLAWAAPIGRVQDGFERHAQALKERAESLRQGS